VADSIAQQCRANERAYRYGGEEFVIIYSDEGLAGAIVAGERLRGAVEALAIPHAANTPPVMTISVGIATWDQARERDTAAVLREADAALYEAKEHGRNRVVGRAFVTTWTTSTWSPPGGRPISASRPVGGCCRHGNPSEPAWLPTVAHGRVRSDNPDGQAQVAPGRGSWVRCRRRGASEASVGCNHATRMERQWLRSR
jgi:hypothetical protein